MKALVLAVTFAALSSAVPAGAGRDAHRSAPQADAAVVTTVVADANRLNPATLTSLNGATHWAPAPTRQAAVDFDTLTEQVDLGALVVFLTVVAVALARPVTRALRRQEQQRRAAALASSLGRTPHG